MPLLQGNVANLTTFDIKDALTGPVERNDVVTIKKHLNAFNQENLNQEKEIYKLLSQRLIEIAQSKNSLKDYSEMKEVLIVKIQYQHLKCKRKTKIKLQCLQHMIILQQS